MGARRLARGTSSGRAEDRLARRAHPGPPEALRELEGRPGEVQDEGDGHREDEQEARRVRQLRARGFGFAVDDAGAGYASFSLIAALKPSLIKIDRDIVRGIARQTSRQALVEAFVGFARRIGSDLAAEGIERTADLDALRDLGVTFGQGWMLGRPTTTPQPARRVAGHPTPGMAALARPRRGRAVRGGPAPTS